MVHSVNNYIPTDKATFDFTILIPVYNSENSLPLVLEGVRKVFSNSTYSYEFVLADDASLDNSWRIIQEQHKKGDITAVRFLNNTGHSMALKRAFEFCRGNWVITMDDDLQHPPSEIPKLIKATEEFPEMDVIMGAYNAKRSKPLKSLGATLYQSILKSNSKCEENVTITSFRVLHRRVINEIISNQHSAPHAGFMILKSTQKIMSIPVEYHQRTHGTSGMTFKKSIQVFLDGLVTNSELPLKFISTCGLVITFSSFILAAYYSIQHLIGNIGISGFTTIVVLISAFSGLILMSLSIIGLYIVRILKQVTYSPFYSLRNFLPHPKQDE